MPDLFAISFTSVGDEELFSAVSEFVGVSLDPGDRQSEGYTVDFKQEWSDKSLRVVAAFANTFGGVIVIGVSEDSGRASEIIGVTSTRELKTQIAGSIAGNITPTPDYDIAECAFPSDPSKRLAVIRVRANQRLHYLLKGNTPVYVRNQDQVSPAGVPELRALIERERVATSGVRLAGDPFELFPTEFKVTRAKGPGSAEERRKERKESQSFIRVAVRPQRPISLSLDYSQDETFKNHVAAEFTSYQEAVFNDMASESEFRNRGGFVYKNLRDGQDIEAVWSVLSNGAVGFATTIGIQAARLSWSLPDVAANIDATILLADRVLIAAGYYGEIELTVDLQPGGGVLFEDGAGLGPLLRKDVYPRGWPMVIPQYKQRPIHAKAIASETLTFDERFGDRKAFLARILNELLRDAGYAPDLNALREAI
jgi:Putative DNA-binding domain